MNAKDAILLGLFIGVALNLPILVWAFLPRKKDTLQ